jgi:transposase
MDATNPFALILAGQPMLLRQLKMGLYAALDQRLATRYQVQPLDLAEAVQYLRHHIALAGRREVLVADDAIARLHQASNGLPRALNNLARDAIIEPYWVPWRLHFLEDGELMAPTHASQKRYPPELRDRAVRMVKETVAEHGGERYGVVSRVAKQLGVTPESLRLWVKQAEIDQAQRPGATSEERRRIVELEKENRELRRANEILKAASAFFARELDPRSPRS